MTMAYKQTTSFKKPSKKKRSCKMQENGLSGSDAALIALVVIAIVLFLALAGVVNEAVSQTPEVAILTSSTLFTSPQYPPDTPTPEFQVYAPLTVKDYVAPTPGPTPTRRPTLAPQPCEPVELIFSPRAYALGGGEWYARVFFSCEGGGLGTCFYYIDGVYLGYGVDGKATTLSCGEAYGPHTFGVYRMCPGFDELLYDEVVWRILPPAPCP